MTVDPRQLETTIVEVLSSELTPLSPSSEVRTRLLENVRGPARYLPFCSELAGHFALSPVAMRGLLSQIDEPGRWMSGIDPIQGFLHFTPGDTLVGLHGGFVRMRHGMQFPLHRHRDRELTYILEGALTDGLNTRKGPGEAFDMAAGSEHTLRVESDCLIALLHGGIEMLGG
jgi:quercetin dioxygenase-like cupin family protein